MATDLVSLSAFAGLKLGAVEVTTPVRVTESNDPAVSVVTPVHQWVKVPEGAIAVAAQHLRLFRRKDQGSLTNAQSPTRMQADASYEAVYSALSIMASLIEGDDLAITSDAERDARSFVMLLALYGVPAPKLMSHSGDTVVLGWRKADLQQYLTLEEGSATLLRVSNSPRRKMSCEFDRNDDKQLSDLIKTLGGKQWKASAT